MFKKQEKVKVESSASGNKGFVWITSLDHPDVMEFCKLIGKEKINQRTDYYYRVMNETDTIVRVINNDHVFRVYTSDAE